MNQGNVRSSAVLSTLAAALVAVLWVVVRAWIFSETLLPITYVLPMMICIWTRRYWHLWAMAVGFGVTVVVNHVVTGYSPHSFVYASLFNIAVGSMLIAAIMQMRSRLEAQAQHLAKQNTEIAEQAEELAQQNQEIAEQSEELSQQNEEMQSQSEELERQYEELQQANSDLLRQEELLQAFLENTRTPTSGDGSLDEMCRKMLLAIGAPATSIAIVERQGDRLTCLGSAGPDGETLPEEWSYSGSLAELVIREEKTACVDDLGARPDISVPCYSGPKARSALAAPIRTRNAASGAVVVCGSEICHWSEEQFRTMTWIAGQCSLILEALAWQNELREVALIPQQNPDAVIRIREDGVVIYANQPGERMLNERGAAGEAIAPRELWQAVVESLRSNRITDAEVTVGERMYAVRYVPVAERRYVNVYAHDMTKRLRLQEQFRHVLDSSEDVVYRRDLREDRYDYISPSCLDVFGISSDQMAGMTTEQIVARMHPDDVPLVRRGLQLVEQTGAAHVEYRWRRPDGQWRWMADHVRQARDSAGAPVYRSGSVRDITEQKRSEAALRESEEKYRSLFDNMSEGFAIGEVICDAEGNQSDIRFLEINQAFVRQTGLSRDITRKPLRTVLPNLEEHWISNYSNVARTGEPLHFDAPNLDTGRHYDVFCYQPAQNRFAIIFTDVTERKKAEEALRRTTERYALLSDTAALLLRAGDPRTIVQDLYQRVMRHLNCEVFVNYLLDEQSGRLHLNTSAGVPADEVASIEWLDLGVAVCGCVARDRAGIVVGDIQNTPDPRTDLVRSFGVQAYCCSPLMIGDRLIGTLSFGTKNRVRFSEDEIDLMRVVADQIAVAIERIRAEEALRRRAEEVERLLDVVPAAVWVAHDPQCLKITGNRRANEFYEASDGENVSASTDPVVRRFFDVEGRALSPDELPMQAAAARNKAVRDCELSAQMSSGRRIDMLGSAVPLRDESGQVRGCIGAFMDITELKRSEAALREAKNAAEAANHAKDHFLAALSHELRTPLTPVLTAASLMENDPRLTPELRDDAAMIRRNVTLETRLIDDLLDLTRINQGKLPLQMERVDVCELLRHAASICSSEADAKNLRLTLDLSQVQGSAVEGDSARLQQVFWNLLKNAIKFTPDGGSIVVCGRTTEHAAQAVVVIDVTDTGIGIPRATRERLFRPFEQGDPSITRQFGGLGLGLTICRSLLDLHGGTIEAISEGAGKGSTFRVVLPRAHATPNPARSGEDCFAPAVARLATRLCILLVEDHEDTAKLMTRVLKMAGHTVHKAADVSTALEVAGQVQFQLVLSDLGLPDGSGLDLMRALRRSRNGFKAIALSGYGTDADQRRSAEAGFDAHLTKPVNLELLTETIRKLTAEAAAV